MIHNSVLIVGNQQHVMYKVPLLTGLGQTGHDLQALLERYTVCITDQFIYLRSLLSVKTIFKIMNMEQLCLTDCFTLVYWEGQGGNWDLN